jgi:hypothetical protein
MPRGLPDDRDLARFVPRITILLVAGFALFLLSAGLYVLPVLREPPPPGAIPDYRKERVIARLEGKVLWFLAGSMITVTLIGTRGGRKRRSGRETERVVGSSSNVLPPEKG